MKNYPLYVQRQGDDLKRWIHNYWAYENYRGAGKRQRRAVLTRVARLRRLLDEIEQAFTETEAQ